MFKTNKKDFRRILNKFKSKVVVLLNDYDYKENLLNYLLDDDDGWVYDVFLDSIKDYDYYYQFRDITCLYFVFIKLIVEDYDVTNMNIDYSHYISYQNIHKKYGISHQRVKARLEKNGFLKNGLPTSKCLISRNITLDITGADEYSSMPRIRLDEDVFLLRVFFKEDFIVSNFKDYIKKDKFFYLGVISGKNSLINNFSNIFSELETLIESRYDTVIIDEKEWSEILKIQEWSKHESSPIENFVLLRNYNEEDILEYLISIKRAIYILKYIRPTLAKKIERAFNKNFFYLNNFIENGRGK